MKENVNIPKFKNDDARKMYYKLKESKMEMNSVHRRRLTEAAESFAREILSMHVDDRIKNNAIDRLNESLWWALSGLKTNIFEGE